LCEIGDRPFLFYGLSYTGSVVLGSAFRVEKPKQLKKATPIIEMVGSLIIFNPL
jgi:hypothetical protein